MKKFDTLIGIGLLVFSAFFLWMTSKISVPKMFESLSSRLWPATILILLGICSIFLIIRSVKAQTGPNGKDSEVEYSLDSSLGMLVCFIFSLLLGVLGFFITIPIFLFLFMYVLRVRNIKSLLLVPPATTAILGYLFTRIVYLPFPKGVGIFYKINAFFY